MSLVSSAIDLEIPLANNKLAQDLPADIRLNMLTGVSTPMTKSRSLVSSTSTVGERSKDALVRINELIRQSSVQDVEKKMLAEVEQDDDDDDMMISSGNLTTRRRSVEINPIEYYINETKKLTSNLETSTRDSANGKLEAKQPIITNLDDEQCQKVSFPTHHRSNSSSSHSMSSRAIVWVDDTIWPVYIVSDYVSSEPMSDDHHNLCTYIFVYI